MKIYGELVSEFFVTNPEGDKIQFFVLKDLNSKDDNQIHVNLGEHKATVGDRVAFTATKHDSVYFATSKVKTYQNKPSSSGKDNTGISVGHAINGSAFLLANKDPDKELIVEKAKMVHTITVNLKEEYRKLNPNLSEYDLGASVGNAVLNGCKIASKKDQLDEESVMKFSKVFLYNVVPEVWDFVSNSQP